LAFVVAVGAAFAGATGAFFSDEERSVGNVLAAGDIDLKIDNESYYNGVLSTSTTWELVDLTNELFFNFSDLKPGDVGEDTISLHVGSNPAWLCMDVVTTATDDNGLTEPEGSDGDATAGPGEGELQNFLNFVWWSDDGDNVLEDNEVTTASTSQTLAHTGTTTVAIADTSGTALLGTSTPVAGDSTSYIGKAWCFGDLTLSALAQDGLGTTSPRTPANSTGGVACNGAPVDNTSQTDSVVGDISFRAVQQRNNTQFVCNAPVIAQDAL
jgi:hypothetical protein